MDCMDLVDEFWEQSGMDRQQEVWVEGENRCRKCGKVFAREQDLKAHHTKKGACKWKEVQRVGSRAERKVQREVRARVMQEKGQLKQDQNLTLLQFGGSLLLALDGQHLQIGYGG